MATATYEDLLVDAHPSKIETDAEYDAIHARFGELFRKPRRTKAEGRLMDLLGLLIEDYDRRVYQPEGSTPAEILQFLMDQPGRKSADLLPIFGQRSHVNEALNGKRTIGADQALKLGEMFKVHPGIFIWPAKSRSAR